MKEARPRSPSRYDVGCIRGGLDRCGAKRRCIGLGMSASTPLLMYRRGCVRMPLAMGERPASATFIGIKSSLEDGDEWSESIEDAIGCWTTEWTERLVLLANSAPRRIKTRLGWTHEPHSHNKDVRTRRPRILPETSRCRYRTAIPSSHKRQ